MTLRYDIGWQRIPYPPFWEGANDITMGGQQVSPDNLYLYVWQTGLRTGGTGQLAIYSTVDNLWTQFSFPGARQPYAFSSITPKRGIAGFYILYIDAITSTIRQINLSGPVISSSAPNVTEFNMVNNPAPFPLTIVLGIPAILSLSDDPGVLYVPYGNRISPNSSAIQRINLETARRIYLCDPQAFGELATGNGAVPGIIGRNGNGSQSVCPGRWYNDQHALTGDPPDGTYCSGSSCLSDNNIVDYAFWTNPATTPFPCTVYNVPPFPGGRLNAFGKHDTGFEYALTLLAYLDATISLDGSSYAKAYWNGSNQLAAVDHCPFNRTTGLIGFPIHLPTPSDFTDTAASLWEMGGNTYILDSIGNFYRLSLNSTFLNLVSLDNWRRAINQRGY